MASSIVLPSFTSDPNAAGFTPRPADTGRVYGTFEYVPAYQGDEGLVLPFEEAAGQTFKAGDLVILSGARVAIATSPSSGTETILGFAMNDATGVTGFRCDVRVPRPGDTFTAALISSQTFTAGTTAGTSMGLTKAQPGIWVVDPAGAAVVMVITSQQFGPQGLTASAGGRVYVRFI
jgi:hypothetical protein